ncbi:MAG: hypothetical protein N2383_03555 [Caldilineales bacterium]|nr:hypothetical protein [Caldilineales bacterium]
MGNFLVTLRDIAIVVLAIESFVVGVILIILLWQIRHLIVMLRQEIKPVLASTQETADTLRNTTRFMSKRVAQPVVDLVSLAAGVRQGLIALRRQAGERRANHRSAPDEEA